MKIFLALFLCCFGLYSFSQFSDREQELMEFESRQDSIQREIFLDLSAMANMSLSTANKTRQIWQDFNSADAVINQFYDIRLKFDSHEAALAFHRKYRLENAEYGEEIKKHKINKGDAFEFHAYHGAASVNSLMSMMGFRAYCYTFVSGNYFVKFYISCKKETKPALIQPYLDEALKKL